MQLPAEIYDVIIASADQKDRTHVYSVLLSIPPFARTLTPGRILHFMVICGVDVHIVSECILGIQYIRWTLNNQTHSFYDIPAVDSVLEVSWYKHGKLQLWISLSQNYSWSMSSVKNINN